MHSRWNGASSTPPSWRSSNRHGRNYSPRSLSDIDRSTAANDPRPSASYSALHLAASSSPRHERNVGQAPRIVRSFLALISCKANLGPSSIRSRLGRTAIDATLFNGMDKAGNRRLCVQFVVRIKRSNLVTLCKSRMVEGRRQEIVQPPPSPSTACPIWINSVALVPMVCTPRRR